MSTTLAPPCRSAAPLLLGAALAFPMTAPAAPQGGLVSGDALYAQAMQAFRAGRFPDAYGRFVALADAGHAQAARHALWMCEHGPALFGSQWDCGPSQVEDWAGAAGAQARSPGCPATANTSRGAGHGRR